MNSVRGELIRDQGQFFSSPGDDEVIWEVMTGRCYSFKVWVVIGLNPRGCKDRHHPGWGCVFVNPGSGLQGNLHSVSKAERPGENRGDQFSEAVTEDVSGPNTVSLQQSSECVMDREDEGMSDSAVLKVTFNDSLRMPDDCCYPGGPFALELLERLVYQTSEAFVACVEASSHSGVLDALSGSHENDRPAHSTLSQ